MIGIIYFKFILKFFSIFTILMNIYWQCNKNKIIILREYLSNKIKSLSFHRPYLFNFSIIYLKVFHLKITIREVKLILILCIF